MSENTETMIGTSLVNEFILAIVAFFISISVSYVLDGNEISINAIVTGILIGAGILIVNTAVIYLNR